MDFIVKWISPPGIGFGQSYEVVTFEPLKKDESILTFKLTCHKGRFALGDLFSINLRYKGKYVKPMTFVEPVVYSKVKGPYDPKNQRFSKIRFKIQEILKLHPEGTTVRQIASKSGLTKLQVKGHLSSNRHNYDRPEWGIWKLKDANGHTSQEIPEVTATE